MSASRALPCRPEDVSTVRPDCEGTGTHKDKHRSEARITTVPDVDRGAEEASAMNDYEILRVIDFVERTREPFAKLMPVSDEEPIWKIIAFWSRARSRARWSPLRHWRTLSGRTILDLTPADRSIDCSRPYRPQTAQSHREDLLAASERRNYQGLYEVCGPDQRACSPRRWGRVRRSRMSRSTISAARRQRLPITPPFGLVEKRYSENVELSLPAYPTTTISRPCATCGWISATIWRHGAISTSCRCRIFTTAPSRTAPNGFRTTMS